MRSIDAVTVPVSTWSPSRSVSPTTFDYIDLGAVDNERKVITSPAKVSTADAPSRARQLVAAGDVLVSTVRPNLNAVAVVPPSLHGATASTGFTVLRPSEELHGRYLFHWVRSPTFIEDMVRKATGASYPAVSDRIIKDAIIRLPPLNEQRRIAAILDKGDALRRKRHQVLEHLDDLASSLLAESLHDLGVDEWQPFGDVCKRLTVGVVIRPASYYVATGVPALRTLNVKPGRLDLRELVYFLPCANDGPLAKSKLRANDLVVARTGRPGTAAVVPPELDGANAIDLIVVTPDPQKAVPSFLEGLLNSPVGQRIVAGEQRGQVQQHFNAGSLRSALIPVPPMAAQERLAQRVLAVSQHRHRQHQQAAALDSLFKTLQKRAFGGIDGWDVEAVSR